MHTPEVHTWLPTHLCPHVPQLLRSDAVSTQAPEHVASPALHWTPHFCATQVATPFVGAGQVVLHPPQ